MLVYVAFLLLSANGLRSPKTGKDLSAVYYSDRIWLSSKQRNETVVRDAVWRIEVNWRDSAIRISDNAPAFYYYWRFPLRSVLTDFDTLEVYSCSLPIAQKLDSVVAGTITIIKKTGRPHAADIVVQWPDSAVGFRAYDTVPIIETRTKKGTKN